MNMCGQIFLMLSSAQFEMDSSTHSQEAANTTEIELQGCGAWGKEHKHLFSPSIGMQIMFSHFGLLILIVHMHISPAYFQLPN